MQLCGIHAVLHVTCKREHRWIAASHSVTGINPRHSQGHALRAPLHTTCSKLVVKVQGAANQPHMQMLSMQHKHSTVHFMASTQVLLLCNVLPPSNGTLTCSKRTESVHQGRDQVPPGPNQQAQEASSPSAQQCAMWLAMLSMNKFVITTLLDVAKLKAQSTERRQGCLTDR